MRADCSDLVTWSLCPAPQFPCRAWAPSQSGPPDCLVGNIWFAFYSAGMQPRTQYAGQVLPHRAIAPGLYFQLQMGKLSHGEASGFEPKSLGVCESRGYAEAFSSSILPPSSSRVSCVPYHGPHQLQPHPPAGPGYWVTGCHLTCPIWQAPLMDPPCSQVRSSPLPQSQLFVCGPEEGGRSCSAVQGWCLRTPWHKAAW